MCFGRGGSIFDLVVNIRGSELERQWTTVHRGLPRCATVPIILPDPSFSTYNESFESISREKAKHLLGIPQNGVVILTVGAYFKYLPIDGLDFLATFERILTVVPNSYLIAVGFEADKRWTDASCRFDSRIKTLGVLSRFQLDKVHEATDLYVDGFPFGTTTALLEAGIKGIPVVLTPANCPPPYGTDGVALDNVLVRAETIQEYKVNIIRLLNNLGERNLQGRRVQYSITRHHTGQGWNNYMAQAIAALPLEHQVYNLEEPVPTPSNVHELWYYLINKWDDPFDEILNTAAVRTLSMGLLPYMTKEMYEKFKHYESLGIHKGIPVVFSYFLFNKIFPVLPVTLAKTIYRVFSFLCRPRLFCRLRIRFLRALEGSNSREWYQDYRVVKASRGMGDK